MRTRAHRISLLATLVMAISTVQPTLYAQTQNPIKAARDAFKKAMEDAKRQAENLAPPQPAQPASGAAQPGSPEPTSVPKTGDSPATVTSGQGNGGSADSDGFQSAADLLGPPQPQSSGPSVNAGTAARTAALAAASGKYDIAGLKVGMALKDAMLALKAHNPTLQMEQHTVAYPDLGANWLYGLTFTSPSERVLLELTLPPNPIVVSRLSRVLNFTRASAPTQQVLVADLIRKYGPPSYDNGASQLNDANLRILLWMDDMKGKRLDVSAIDRICSGAASFSIIGDRQATEPPQYRPEHMHSKLEARYSLRGENLPGESACLDHLIMEARLPRCCRDGLAAPDLVGGLTVSHYDAPLDINATGATHQLLVEAVSKRDQQEQDNAQKNRPKL